MAHTPDLYPPDYATGIGQVRLLIPDTEQLENPADLTADAEYIFDDHQIQAFLSMSNNSIKRAAAEAKMVLAASETLISKVIRTDDLQTDGAKLGAELRAQARELRAQAVEEETYDSYEEFEIVDFNRSI
jgi:hypothetical protein